jgi:tetratricopeptide (TPR) repeat protein
MQLFSPSSYIIPVFIILLAPGVRADTTAGLASAGHETSDYATVLRRALDLASHHDYASASDVLEKALAEASKNNNVVVAAVILDDAGMIYMNDRKYDAAEQAYKRSISLWTQVKGPRASQLASPLGNLGNLYYQAGQYSRSEKLTAQAISILKETNDDSPELATLVSNLAAVYLGQHKEDMARKTAEDAMRIFDTLGPGQQAGKGAVYSVMGAVYSRSRQYAMAESCLQQALSIWENAWGREDPHTAEGMANLGILFSLSGDLEKSESFFQKAEEIFARSGGNDTFLTHFFREYAALERKLGHKGEAKQLAKRTDEMSNASAASILSRNLIDVSAFQNAKK